MTGILNILAGSISSAIKDGYFNLVSLLLPGNGTNGAQNNTFLDSSTNNFTITRNGNTTQGTFSPFSQTGWGNYFNGTNASLTYPNNTAFAFGTGAFTIEFWINGPSNDGSFILGGRSAIGTMHITTGGSGSGTTVSCLRYVGSSTITTGSTLITNNSWNHCAIVRDGSNNITLYVNGVSAGTGTDTTNYTTTSGTWYIGQNDSGSANYLQGYISNLRILKGTALYTGSFTPPTAPLTAITNTSLLTCQSNRFIDNSANAFAITVNGTPSVQAFSPFAPTAAYSAATNGGSGYFDGTGDSLTVTYNAAQAPGSSNFTVEGWYYITETGTTELPFFVIGSNTYYPIGLSFNHSSGYKVQVNASYSGSSWAFNRTGNITIPTYSWVHVAVVRNGTALDVYVNGVKDASASGAISGSLASDTGGISIGAYRVGGTAEYFGYIGGTRYVVGTAVYTAAFTPPTSPFSSTSATLCLNFTNAGIIDATGKNDLETVGNAQISTTQSKWGGSSMYFDGTGDYLYKPNEVVNQLGTGDYTIEFWVYGSSWSSLPVLLEYGRPSSAATPGLQFYIATTSGRLDIYGGTGTGTLLISAGSNISTTTWTHVALTRASGSTKLFLNGTQTGSTATDNTNYSQATIWIGAIVAGSTNNFSGYIDDLRITKGYARYTANFSVPTAAFALQ